MKPEEQRVAIAEACGHKYHKPTDEEIKSGSYYQYEPDYLNDLNAMHVAELVLDENQRLVYGSRLYEVTGAWNKKTGRCEGWKEIHSTASQRAEAFLRTLNLWKE